jgi:hypothetical protein
MARKFQLAFTGHGFGKYAAKDRGRYNQSRIHETRNISTACHPEGSARRASHIQIGFDAYA